MAASSLTAEHIRNLQDLIKAKQLDMEEKMIHPDRWADAIAGTPIKTRNYGSGGSSGNASSSNKPAPPPYERMLEMRMRWGVGEHPSFNWLIARELTPEKIVVLGIRKGEVVQLTDDASMFPSDTLISQLRLLIG